MPLESTVQTVIRDYSDEYASVSVRVQDLADDGSNMAAVLADMATLRTNIAILCAGSIAYQTISFKEIVNDTRPAAPTAQREIKYLVGYQDNVNAKRFNITLPVAAPELTEPGSDRVDINSNVIAAPAVNAIEGVLVTPYGNAGTIERVTLVGRNV